MQREINIRYNQILSEQCFGCIKQTPSLRDHDCLRDDTITGHLAYEKTIDEFVAANKLTKLEGAENLQQWLKDNWI